MGLSDRAVRRLGFLFLTDFSTVLVCRRVFAAMEVPTISVRTFQLQTNPKDVRQPDPMTNHAILTSKASSWLRGGKRPARNFHGIVHNFHCPSAQCKRADYTLLHLQAPHVAETTMKKTCISSWIWPGARRIEWDTAAQARRAIEQI
jgi:hypothetical protein